jgi:hypothetical protein
MIAKDVRDKLDPSKFEDNTECDWANMPLEAWDILLVADRFWVNGITKGGRHYFGMR